MQCVQFRIKDNALEYRALVLRETEQELDNGGVSTSISINSPNEYTEWKPVPKVPIKPVQPTLTQEEIAELQAEENAL